MNTPFETILKLAEITIIEEQLSTIYDEINTYLNFDLFIPKNE